jgi:hypothetical protein
MAAAMVAGITGGEDKGVIIKRRQQNYEVSLSAHSFDFVGHDIPGRIREMTVDVSFVDTNNAGGDAATCVGPGTVTVTQAKVFSTSDGIDLSTP